MNWMIRIYHKYRLEIRYLFFGVLTTIVNYASFAAALWLLGTSATLVANAVSFVLATAFAYVTNKRFVFRSPGWRPSVIAHEFAAFTGARLFSFALEELGLLIGVHGLGVAKYQRSADSQSHSLIRIGASQLSLFTLLDLPQKVR